MNFISKSVRRFLAAAAPRSGIAARVLTALTSSSVRETQAVVSGIASYRQSIGLPRKTLSLLRRNTHRLEKGLIMIPRRPVFATDYISETVACYERCLQQHANDLFDPVELTWAYDVLQRYFSTVSTHPAVDAARARFEALAAPSGQSTREKPFAPYARDLATPLKTTLADLRELAVRRRSVRWFLPRPVPHEMIDQAIEIAGLSPSACNRQPFEFRVFDDPDLVRQVTALPGGVGGYAQNIPVIVVVVGQLWHFAGDQDRHLIYTDASLAIMSFVFGLEVQGLSSCCVNWPDIREREQKMAALLGLRRDERPIMLVALGYPDPAGMVPYSAKKPLALLRSYNRTCPA
ncbi:nitroreductase [bacterium]|nr:nitroreductase [bacterium]